MRQSTYTSISALTSMKPVPAQIRPSVERKLKRCPNCNKFFSFSLFVISLRFRIAIWPDAKRLLSLQLIIKRQRQVVWIKTEQTQILWKTKLQITNQPKYKLLAQLQSQGMYLWFQASNIGAAFRFHKISQVSRKMVLRVPPRQWNKQITLNKSHQVYRKTSLYRKFKKKLSRKTRTMHNNNFSSKCSKTLRSIHLLMYCRGTSSSKAEVKSKQKHK